MSLADKLQKLQDEQRTLCKIGVVLEKLPPKDSAALVAVLAAPEGQPNRLSNVQIARFLKEENYSLSVSSVDRHRRGDCACSQ